MWFLFSMSFLPYARITTPEVQKLHVCMLTEHGPYNSTCAYLETVLAHWVPLLDELRTVLVKHRHCLALQNGGRAGLDNVPPGGTQDGAGAVTYKRL
jgi:hypothetical protein